MDGGSRDERRTAVVFFTLTSDTFEAECTLDTLDGNIIDCIPPVLLLTACTKRIVFCPDVVVVPLLDPLVISVMTRLVGAFVVAPVTHLK